VQAYVRKQTVISGHISRESYVTVTGNTNATPEDGCALSTLSDLLCYVRELHVQNCLYGNGWKQKENGVDTCILASNVMNYLRKTIPTKRGLSISVGNKLTHERHGSHANCRAVESHKYG
jgi:hypothetical protein